jgi:hypothetical protein
VFVFTTEKARSCRGRSTLLRPHPTHLAVIPAKAGIFIHQAQDPGLRRDDKGKESRDDRIEKNLRETPCLRASVVNSLNPHAPTTLILGKTRRHTYSITAPPVTVLS